MTDVSSPIRWEQDQDGVVTLVLDDPAQSANTMNAAFTDALEGVVERLSATEELTGVVVTSAKKTFFARGARKHHSAAPPPPRARGVGRARGR
ncbi:3-hydroxyacyl-CoA dehydrogenase, partial [Kitasatospora phosalacinea]